MSLHNHITPEQAIEVVEEVTGYTHDGITHTHIKFSNKHDPQEPDVELVSIKPSSLVLTWASVFRFLYETGKSDGRRMLAKQVKLRLSNTLDLL